MNTTMIQKARTFQRAAHSACGQVRKQSGIPYHTHPEAVLAILSAYVPDATWEMRCAALLHDILEDTKIGPDLLAQEFGQEVTRLVIGCTNVKDKSLNRAAQKAADALRLSETCYQTKTIKLADCIHNMGDIVRDDPNFAPTFMGEKRTLIDTALVGGDSLLWFKADDMLKKFFADVDAT